jgi:hypothetical protein
MKIFSLVILAVLFIAGCGNKEDSTKEFLVVDSGSNKILNKYEYIADTDELARTYSYTDDEKIEKKIDYEYDSNGYLVKTVEYIPGKPEKTVTYETTPEYDSSGRLVKLVRISSEGKIVETHFGYDETGTLRGVVEKDNRSALMMQDY